MCSHGTKYQNITQKRQNMFDEEDNMITVQPSVYKIHDNGTKFYILYLNRN